MSCQNVKIFEANRYTFFYIRNLGNSLYTLGIPFLQRLETVYPGKADSVRRSCDDGATVIFGGSCAKNEQNALYLKMGFG